MLVCVSLHNLARETAGAARTRLSLRPLAHEGGTSRPNLARNMRRDREAVSRRHCERSEAIQLSCMLRHGLLRCARNEGGIQLRDLAACFARGLVSCSALMSQ